MTFLLQRLAIYSDSNLILNLLNCNSRINWQNESSILQKAIDISLILTLVTNPCREKECGNGSCAVVDDAAVCTCNSGWTGDSCDNVRYKVFFYLIFENFEWNPNLILRILTNVPLELTNVLLLQFVTIPRAVMSALAQAVTVEMVFLAEMAVMVRF